MEFKIRKYCREESALFKKKKKILCTEIDFEGAAFGINPAYPDNSDIKIIIIGTKEDLENGSIMEYITVNTSTLEGLIKSEKLKQNGWKIGSTGFFTIQFYRKTEKNA